MVMWLWHSFSSQPPDIALPCMLELLTVLPEVRPCRPVPAIYRPPPPSTREPPLQPVQSGFLLAALGSVGFVSADPL